MTAFDATAAVPRRGLLMDWGGVLTTNVFASFERFCVEHGLKPTTVADLFMGDPHARQLLGDFESGRLPEHEFEPQFAERLGLDAHDGLIARLFGSMEPDEPMQQAVAAARAAGIRTGLLSNSWGANTYPHERLAELFDVLVISGEEGVRKPEPEIYVIATERMALPADQLVFVDDLRGNLKPARALGMATVHHTEAAATIAELEGLLGVTL